jgi:transcription initiation factor TFIIE subunit alpha
LSAFNIELLKASILFGGEDATKVIKALLKLREATDDEVAKESDLSLNIVRKVLYKLYDHSLITCTRERNDQTGWYTFRWRIQPSQLDAFIRIRKRRTLEKFRNRLRFEKEHSFFICEKCPDIRVTFEEAIESAFRCSKCGGQFVSSNNEYFIDKLSEIIEKLQKELNN